MTDERAYYQSLAFVRSAQAGDDEEVIKHGGTLWHEPDGTEVWLPPETLMRQGLTDKMREAINRREIEEREGATKPISPLMPTHRPLEPPPGAIATVVGGSVEGWTWDIAKIDDVVTILVSNKPAIEAATEDLDSRVPQLQQAALPLDVLRAIVANT